MNPPHCDRESEVVKAARTGFWPDNLRSHTESCEACSEALLVSHYLNEEAASALDEAEALSPLPEAGLVWWKAQLQVRRETARRATRPVAIVEALSSAIGLVAAVALLVWAWPQVRGWSALFRLAGFEWNVFSGGLALYLIGGAALLLTSMVIFGAWAIRAEDHGK